jgi:hypothetical protein
MSAEGEFSSRSFAYAVKFQAEGYAPPTKVTLTRRP